jgi:hypothetical protein
MPPGRSGTGEAGLVDLARGERRPARLPAGRLSDLSWAGDRRTVAFTSHPEPGGQPGVYVTGTDLGDWVTGGRLVDATRGLPDDLIDPVISADGGDIYCTVAQPDPHGGPHWNRLLAIPVHGGQPRVLFQLRYGPTAAARATCGPRPAVTSSGATCSHSPSDTCTASRSLPPRSPGCHSPRGSHTPMPGELASPGREPDV